MPQKDHFLRLLTLIVKKPALHWIDAKVNSHVLCVLTIDSALEVYVNTQKNTTQALANIQTALDNEDYFVKTFVRSSIVKQTSIAAVHLVFRQPATKGNFLMHYRLKRNTLPCVCCIICIRSIQKNKESNSRVCVHFKIANLTQK